MSERYRTVGSVDSLWGPPILKLHEVPESTRLDSWEQIRDATAAAIPIVTQTEIWSPDEKLRAIIEADLSDSSLDVDTLSRKTGLSKTNLHSKLSALTGLSTTIYVRKIRLHKAKELLGTTDMNISEIAYTVGFNDPKFFSRVFSEEFGITCEVK